MSCVPFIPPSWRISASALVPDEAGAVLSDVFAAPASDAGALGFVLARIPRQDKPVLWVQDRLSLLEAGRPFLAGLGNARILRVEAGRAADVLWAMEEGLRDSPVAAIIGEMWGDPPALDFTATKRLALRSHARNIPVWLIRRAASPNLSAARNRWRVTSMPSLAGPHDPEAPGDPCWRVELFRSRTLQTGQWIARYDRAAHHLHFSAPSGDGTLAEIRASGDKSYAF